MENKMMLGKTSLQVSRLGLGAMTWGSPTGWARWLPAQRAYGPSHGLAEEAGALEASLAAGVNLVDTAEFYSAGAAESRLGELTHGMNVLIASKFPPSLFSTADNFPQALEQSLQRLQRKTIDLFQIHYSSRRLSIPALMNCMADAVQAGKVRAVGVSNYSAAEMRLAQAELAKRGLPLASNQVEYSLLHRRPEVDGVLEACRELGVTLIAYSPLAQGALTGKYTAAARPQGWRRFMGSFRGKGIEAVQPVVALLREIGAKYSKTSSQVALRWLIEQEIVLPIPGAKNRRQAEENAGALTFTLNSEEVEAISSAAAAWRV